MFLYKAAALLAALSVAAAAQLYEHPRLRWRIDFPPGWAVRENAPEGAVAEAPRGGARLTVVKARAAGAATAAEWERASTGPRRRPSYRELRRSPVTLRGLAGLRVEYSFADAAGREMKGWRTVLAARGIVNEVRFEAAAGEYARGRLAAEAALRSFLPSFTPL